MKYSDEQKGRLTQRKAIQKIGIRGNNQFIDRQLQIFPSQGKLWWQNLLQEIISTYTPSWKPHFHSLQAMTQGFSHSKGEEKKLLQQSSTVTQTYFRCRAVYDSSVHHSHSFATSQPHYCIWGLHTQSREHAPQNLPQYFLEYCFCRFVGIKHKSMKGIRSYFKLIVGRKKHIYKLYIFWSLSTFQFSSSLFEKEY